MSAYQQIKLHRSGSGTRAIRIVTTPPYLKVEYEFHNGEQDALGTIAFDGVIAFRFRDELRSLGNEKSSLDAVAVVECSNWILELAKIEPSMFADSERCSHYAMMFSNNGYLEVIAEAVEHLPTRPGVIKT